jgi:murein L,D-transpeptidase YafK
MQNLNIMKMAAIVAATSISLSSCAPGGGTPDIPHPPPLEQRLATHDLRAGAAVFIRVFKTENRLELWLRHGDQFRLFETYPICKWSGRLGPKLNEGDGQAPEGFYVVTPSQMNAHSHYHRAFNLGFPNAFDRASGRTGSNIMIHGGCGSVGCYAMTDGQIDEIFNLMKAAFANGQQAIDVDVLPFSPTPLALTAHANDPAAPFWKTLAMGEAAFKRTGRPSAVYTCGKTYAFVSGVGCLRIRNGG